MIVDTRWLDTGEMAAWVRLAAVLELGVAGPDEFPWGDLCEALIRLDRVQEAREALDAPGKFVIVRGELTPRCWGQSTIQGPDL